MLNSVVPALRCVNSVLRTAIAWEMTVKCKPVQKCAVAVPNPAARWRWQWLRFSSYPEGEFMPHQQHQAILDIATHCAYECEHCSDACLGDMPDCAKVCRDCAQMCWTTASFISRASRFIPQIVNACIAVCEACAEECEKYPDNPHCQKCAEACRQAVDQYRKVSNLAGVA
jgi:hypothetical protein